MDKASRRTFLATTSATLLVRDTEAAQAVQTPGNHTSNLRLWYSTPASRWVDALPVGNGRLGAMVYGGSEKGAANEELLPLNEDTFWSGQPRDGNNPDAKNHLADVRKAVLEQKDYHLADAICKKMQGLFGEAFQPLGNLRLKFAHPAEVSGYERELNLDTACARTTYTSDGIKFERTVFVSAPHHAMVVRVAADKPGAINCTVSLDGELEKKCETVGSSRLMLTAKAAAHIAGAGHPGGEKPVVLSDVAGEGMYGIAALDVKAAGGSVRPEDRRIAVKNANSITILLTAATGFRGFNQKPDMTPEEIASRAEAHLDKAASQSYDRLFASHVDDHQKLFRRVSLNLGTSPSSAKPTDERLKNFAGAPDPSLLALYFQYGRYLLISSSRTGSQPANLQGIWNPLVTPPWSSNWTANINIQMNYWPAETCNLTECVEPLYGFMTDLSKNGERTATEHYGLTGWVSHHNIDLWRASNPVGEGVGQPTWANWPMSGPWLCQHLYEHYRFTGDRHFLRDQAYPLMKGSAEFCLAWLIDDSNGHLTTCPSESTENSFTAPAGKRAMTSAGCTMDMALMRELFSNCIASAKELGIDSDFAEKLKAARARLLPYKIGKFGQLQEWSIDFEESEPGQRHMSHMYPLYPGGEITPRDTPELARATRISLERRLRAGGAYTGWSRAWAIAFWARLGNGDRAWESLSMLMQHSTNQNLFDTHPAREGPIFQIDGNFGATAGIAEMLMQSHTGSIDLLPALPAAWADGEVKGLRARGGVEIDLRWASRRATECRLSSESDQSIRVRPPQGQQVQSAGKQAPEGVWTVALRRGQPLKLILT